MSGKIGPTQVICLHRGDPFEQNAMELDTAIRRTEEAPWSPQGPARVERRLAAILAADVAVSSSIKVDQEGTFSRLKKYRLRRGGCQRRIRWPGHFESAKAVCRW